MSAFQQTSTLPDPTAGASSHRIVQVRPDAAATGANFADQISFTSYRGGKDEYVNLAESYVTIRLKPLDAGGAALIAGDNMALARFAPAFMFSQIDTRFADQTVEMTTNPAQQALISNHMTRSSDFAETSGSNSAAQALFADRQAGILSSYQRDLSWYPEQGVWTSPKLIRGLPLGLFLTVAPSWEEKLFESTGADKVKTTDFLVTVEDIVLNLSVYKADPDTPTPPLAEDIVDTDLMRINVTSLSAVTSNQVTVGVDSSTYACFTIFQPNTAGTGTLTPYSFTDTGNITSINWDWGGVRMPQVPYSLDFATQRVGRAFRDYVASSNSGMWGTGCLVDFDAWVADPIYAQKLIAGTAGSDDNLTIETTHSAAYTGRMYICTVAPNRVVLKYGQNGLVNNARSTKNSAELAAALSS